MKANNVYYTRIFFLVLFVFVLFLIRIIINPETLSDCEFSESYLKSFDSENKEIVLDIKYDFSKVNNPINHFIFESELFSEINKIIEDSNKNHYFQIWYKYHNVRNKIGSSRWFDYYQIVIDGKIIKIYNKWEHLSSSIIGISICFILLIILIICRPKDCK